MSTESTKARMADTGAPGAVQETQQSAVSQPMGEGLGVFRALLLTALFYVMFGSLIWFPWHAFTSLRSH